MNKFVKFLTLTMLIGATAHAMEPENKGSQLLNAAIAGDLARVKSLVESGAPVNYTAKGEATPLIEAAYAGHTDVVKYLIEKGAHLNELGTNRLLTALMWAVLGGHMSTINALIKAGADLNIQGEYGNTALIFSLRSNVIIRRVAILDALVEAGADLNIQNNQGDTVLIDAARQGQASGNMNWTGLDTVGRLLDAHANPNITNHEGNTALVYASWGNQSQEICQRLITAMLQNPIPGEKEKIVASIGGLKKTPIKGLSKDTRNIIVSLLPEAFRKERKQWVRKQIERIQNAEKRNYLLQYLERQP